jgi:hypothetical protein
MQKKEQNVDSLLRLNEDNNEDNIIENKDESEEDSRDEALKIDAEMHLNNAK